MNVDGLWTERHKNLGNIPLASSLHWIARGILLGMLHIKFHMVTGILINEFFPLKLCNDRSSVNDLNSATCFQSNVCIIKDEAGWCNVDRIVDGFST